MSRRIRGQEGHFGCPIGPKNTNSLEDIDFFLPVKFSQIPFSCFCEIENVLADQRSGRPSRFSDQSEKNINLVKDIEYLLAVKFHWIPFRVREKKLEMYRPIRDQEGHISFLIGTKPKLDRGHWVLPSSQVSLNSVWRWEGVENIPANQRPGKSSWFFDRHQKHKLDRRHWVLPPSQVSLNSVYITVPEKSKMYLHNRGHSGHLGFSLAPKNTNLVEDVDFLLPVKIRKIPISGSEKLKIWNVNDDRRTSDNAWS